MSCVLRLSVLLHDRGVGTQGWVARLDSLSVSLSYTHTHTLSHPIKHTPRRVVQLFCRSADLGTPRRPHRRRCAYPEERVSGRPDARERGRERGRAGYIFTIVTGPASQTELLPTGLGELQTQPRGRAPDFGAGRSGASERQFERPRDPGSREHAASGRESQFEYVPSGAPAGPTRGSQPRLGLGQTNS